jgi:hypothetical protein
MESYGFEVCKWTTFGFIKYPETQSIFSRLKTFEKIPYTNRKDLLKILKEYNNLVESYISSSITSSLSINSVPIRTKERDPEHLFCLDNFFPLKILEADTASDKGLFKCFKYVYDNLLSKTEEHIVKPIVVDINIYWRYYLWLYNKNNDLFYSKNLCIVLGFWHTYKELSIVIWKSGLRTLFGPIYHEFYPQAKIFSKPKLGHLETFFTWITLAFKDVSIRDKLDSYIENTFGSQQKIFRNIRFLLNSAIPFVCTILIR